MAEIHRSANAVWQGNGKAGSGTISTQSGALSEATYSSPSRFGEDKGTTPEELIAAAHCGCFAMALAYGLDAAGFTPTKLEVTATVTLDMAGGNFTVTRSALTLKGEVPGISEEQFLEAAHGAEKNCPISKVLNAEITLDATLA